VSQRIAAVTLIVPDYDDGIAADHERYVTAGVKFLEPPRTEPYGTVAVFEDAFGNRWDLLEPA
jgi:hypothetical protein